MRAQGCVEEETDQWGRERGEGIEHRGRVGGQQDRLLEATEKTGIEIKREEGLESKGGGEKVQEAPR